ncbi:ArsR transcriptional regulator [mine drainage metagenome]|uniref:ArsR transcriptional regulator n=2 Tax=mine drainage metagenome TaxID=410659 RepID=T1BPZ4_9ZZZZ
MEELADIIYATTMSEKKLEEYEEEIKKMIVPGEGVFLGDVTDKLKFSQTLLRGLIRRSSSLTIKGYKIDLVQES